MNLCAFLLFYQIVIKLCYLAFYRTFLVSGLLLVFWPIARPVQGVLLGGSTAEKGDMNENCDPAMEV